MKLHEIRLTKCTIFLTEQELNKLLAQQPNIWKEALKRGKGILRNRKQKFREDYRDGD